MTKVKGGNVPVSASAYFSTRPSQQVHQSTWATRSNARFAARDKTALSRLKASVQPKLEPASSVSSAPPAMPDTKPGLTTAPKESNIEHQVVGGTYKGQPFTLTLNSSDIAAYKSEVNNDPSKMSVTAYLGARLGALQKARNADPTAQATVGLRIGHAVTDFDRAFRSGADPKDFVLADASLQVEFDKLASDIPAFVNAGTCNGTPFELRFSGSDIVAYKAQVKDDPQMMSVGKYLSVRSCELERARRADPATPATIEVRSGNAVTDFVQMVKSASDHRPPDIVLEKASLQMEFDKLASAANGAGGPTTAPKESNIEHQVVGGTYKGQPFTLMLNSSDIAAYKSEVDNDPSKMSVTAYLDARLGALHKARNADPTAQATVGLRIGDAVTDFDRAFRSGADPKDFVLADASLQVEFDKLASAGNGAGGPTRPSDPTTAPKESNIEHQVVGGTYKDQPFTLTLNSSDIAAYKSEVDNDPSKMSVTAYLDARLGALHKARNADPTAQATVGLRIGDAVTDFDRAFRSGADPKDFVLADASLQVEFDKLASAANGAGGPQRPSDASQRGTPAFVKAGTCNGTPFEVKFSGSDIAAYRAQVKDDPQMMSVAKYLSVRSGELQTARRADPAAPATVEVRIGNAVTDFDQMVKADHRRLNFVLEKASLQKEFDKLANLELGAFKLKTHVSHSAEAIFDGKRLNVEMSSRDIAAYKNQVDNDPGKMTVETYLSTRAHELKQARGTDPTTPPNLAVTHDGQATDLAKIFQQGWGSNGLAFSPQMRESFRILAAMSSRPPAAQKLHERKAVYVPVGHIDGKPVHLKLSSADILTYKKQVEERESEMYLDRYLDTRLQELGKGGVNGLADNIPAKLDGRDTDLRTVLATSTGKLKRDLDGDDADTFFALAAMSS